MGSDMVLNNVESTFKQRWYKNNVAQRCFDVVSTLDNVVSTLGTDVASTLGNVENPTSNFVSFSTSDQRYFNVDPQRWNNVDLTLKCWLGVKLNNDKWQVNSAKLFS